VEVYKRLSQEADAILSVHISSLISGTYNSAVQAREQANVDCPIEVVDTRQASMGLGLIAKVTAEAVRDGVGLDEAKQVAEKAASRAGFFGMVETLEYLQKGGRIGKAQAFLGTLLNVKPILTIREGVTHPLERARTRRKGIDKLCEIGGEYAPLEDLCILHSTTPDDAENMAQRLSYLVPREKILMARIGPVVGAYLGPGALAVALMGKV
jgi:DegV family protein with EDD domain